MSVTNMLQFNPSQANQEDDATYAGDATRVNGALDGNAWPDISANKTLYQLSTYLTALFTAFANKGFGTSDSNLAALTVQCANFLTTADSRVGIQNLSWSPSIAINAASFTGFAIPLQGTTALSISGVIAGQVYVLLYTQDSAGGHTVTFPVNILNALQPDPSPNTLSVQIFIADATLALEPVGPLISNGGINGTAMGVSVAASGRFTTLTLAGGAPLGQVLTGDGVEFVPMTAPGYSTGATTAGQWVKDPVNRIEQWGTAGNAGGPVVNVVFPTPFTTNNFVVQCTGKNFGTGATRGNVYGVSQTQTGFSARTDNSTTAFDWTAVGY